MISNFEITIPVLNEELELVNKVETVINYLSKTYSDSAAWNLVIADNGSTDGTGHLAMDLVEKHPRHVKYLRLNERGVGRALKRSWGLSNADIVGFFDLDLATDLNHLPEALSAIYNLDYDIVYATRLNKRSRVVGRSLKREIVSRIFNFILKKYLNVGFSDGMCGFKFIKRNILSALIEGGATSDGWFFSTEILVVAEKNMFKLYELPVAWTDSSDSKVDILALTIQYLKAMRSLKKHYVSV